MSGSALTCTTEAVLAPASHFLAPQTDFSTVFPSTDDASVFCIMWADVAFRSFRAFVLGCHSFMLLLQSLSADMRGLVL